MKSIPVRGMRDIMPNNMTTREYLLGVVSHHAKMSGFQKIETPAIEHLENLTSKVGGENETLIFKVLKRGESLKSVLGSTNADDLTDSALRYDLTVPLCRYYSNNIANLPTPFKSLQVGSVWRADAPQKGRFRQFTQCDMDIIGDGSILAETTVVSTVLDILQEICAKAKITGLTFHINDRRILTAAVLSAGFDESQAGDILISLDKNDKIGLEGVKQEMIANGFDVAKVEKFIQLFEKDNISIEDFCNQLGESTIDREIVSNLETLKEVASKEGVKAAFNPTLVRGMGYYTGPIFECTADGLGSSIAGGGRYDNMISKFTDGKTAAPACGFSIGFERLITILEDAGFNTTDSEEKVAILIGKKVEKTEYVNIQKEAEELRKQGKIVSIIPMARNLGHQIGQLEELGYSIFDKRFGD